MIDFIMYLILLPNFGREYDVLVGVQLSSQNWSAMSSTARKRENINILVWCHVTIPTAIYFHLTPGLDANTQVIFNLTSNTFSWLKIQIKIKNQNPCSLEVKPTSVISPQTLKFRFWSQHQRLFLSSLSYVLFKRSQKKSLLIFYLSLEALE